MSRSSTDEATRPMDAPTTTDDDLTALTGRLISWLETGEGPETVFAEDLFLDGTFPQWRIQAGNRSDAVAVRVAGHPHPGRVARSRVDRTPTGFVIEWEERWTADGQDWYSREMARAEVRDQRISEFALYCTGDWDEQLVARHHAEVPLLRP